MTTNLANINNLLYIGNIYVGSDQQVMKVVFDTGSDWLVLEDKDCSNCLSTRFNSSTSTSFVVNDTTISSRKYGSASLTGFVGNDTVSLDPTATIKATTFPFFLAKTQTGISA